jgi:hypothetical protein
MPVTRLLKHPIDHTDVKMHMLGQVGAQTVDRDSCADIQVRHDRILIRANGIKQTRVFMLDFFTPFQCD